MIRPEFIELSPSLTDGTMTGVLRDTVYLGETMRFIVDVAGHEIVAKARPKLASVLQIGQTVSLNWQSEDMVVMAA